MWLCTAFRRGTRRSDSKETCGKCLRVTYHSIRMNIFFLFLEFFPFFWSFSWSTEKLASHGPSFSWTSQTLQLKYLEVPLKIKKNGHVLHEISVGWTVCFRFTGLDVSQIDVVVELLLFATQLTLYKMGLSPNSFGSIQGLIGFSDLNGSGIS